MLWCIAARLTRPVLQLQLIVCGGLLKPKVVEESHSFVGGLLPTDNSQPSNFDWCECECGSAAIPVIGEDQDHERVAATPVSIGSSTDQSIVCSIPDRFDWLIRWRRVNGAAELAWVNNSTHNNEDDYS